MKEEVYQGTLAYTLAKIIALRDFVLAAKWFNPVTMVGRDASDVVMERIQELEKENAGLQASCRQWKEVFDEKDSALIAARKEIERLNAQIERDNKTFEKALGRAEDGGYAAGLQDGYKEAKA